VLVVAPVLFRNRVNRHLFVVAVKPLLWVSIRRDFWNLLVVVVVVMVMIIVIHHRDQHPHLSNPFHSNTFHKDLSEISS
jgi:hypothetical protein